MEPDLDRLLDYAARGAVFPQFVRSWSTAFSSVVRLLEEHCPSDGMRRRVVLHSEDALSVCASLVALGRRDVDLFLFSHAWSRRELDLAMVQAKPHFVFSGLKSGKFEYEKFNEDLAESPARLLRVMIPTGGTGGEVRFAIHDWSTLAAATYGLQQHLEVDRIVSHCLLPLYHVSGFMQLVRALLTMGRVVFGKLDTFEQTKGMLDDIILEERFLSLVPTQLERLLRSDSRWELLHDYRAVFVGGGPTATGLLEDGRERGLPLAPTYGMTETAAQVATLLPEQFLAGMGGVGALLPHVTIDLLAREDLSSTVMQGEVGLIRIAGSSVFFGYVGEEPRAGLRALLTSDLGSFDANGNLTVHGRADRVVISGGEKIDLGEVELAAADSGLTRDVLAFGLPDTEWGEKLALAYVPKESLVSEAALREAFKNVLSDFKVPKIWIRKSEIPRNEAGKPRISELREAAKSSVHGLGK